MRTRPDTGIEMPTPEPEEDLVEPVALGFTDVVEKSPPIIMSQ